MDITCHACCCTPNPKPGMVSVAVGFRSAGQSPKVLGGQWVLNCRQVTIQLSLGSKVVWATVLRVACARLRHATERFRLRALLDAYFFRPRQIEGVPQLHSSTDASSPAVREKRLPRRIPCKQVEDKYLGRIQVVELRTIHQIWPGGPIPFVVCGTTYVSHGIDTIDYSV